MNRGSALKWVQAMRETSHSFDNSQLGFEFSDGFCFSPIGILCEFVDPTGMVVNELGYCQWDTECWWLTPDIMKRTKAKSADLSMYDESFYDIVDRIVETEMVRLRQTGRNEPMTSKERFAVISDFVEQNYAVL